VTFQMVYLCGEGLKMCYGRETS